MFKNHVVMILIVPALALSTVSKAQSIVVVDDLGGHHVSLTEVDGRPAMAYERDQRLWYVRANDAKGTTWGSPILVNPTNPWFSRPSLTVIDGHPAISAIDPNWEELVFVRATDPAGDTWGPPVTAYPGIWEPSPTSLATVNGNPAACGSTLSDEGQLVYARATDSTGLVWSTPTFISNSGARSPSYSQIDGHPAYAYSEQQDDFYSDLLFVRGLDVNGDSWGTPIIIDSVSDARNPTMAIIGGRPAIAYGNLYSVDLMFVRSTAIDGSSWETPVILDSVGHANSGSLEVVDGIPLISYYESISNRLMLIQAADPEAEDWFEPTIIDSSGTAGNGGTLASVNSLPAIAYVDYINDDLKYAYDIEVKLFLDGFESGDTLAWSETTP